MVLRVQGATLVSGWPWRWQAVVETPEPRRRRGPHGGRRRLALRGGPPGRGGRRLRCLLPVEVPASRGGFRAGATLMRRTDADGEALLAQLDVNKRRAVKRALREGWVVREAATVEERRAFAVIRREVDRRHGQRAPELPAGTPEPCEDWREWELPWMWLLVAVRDGVVGAGSGFGITPGGTIEYRANASSAEARREGVNALLAWEALRVAHERGCHWMNWGGVTEFKRELGGERVEIHCRLGGGARLGAAERRVRPVARRRMEAAAPGARAAVAAAPVVSGGRPMRVLFVTQYFPPETGAAPARALHFARALERAGHEVRVVTGLPNHPAGVVQPGVPGRAARARAARAASRSSACGCTPRRARRR